MPNEHNVMYLEFENKKIHILASHPDRFRGASLWTVPRTDAANVDKGIMMLCVASHSAFELAATL